jgi:uncharacterized protein (DUF1778 family)
MDGMAAKRRKTKGDRKSEEVRVRVTAEEKETFTAAAKKDDRDLSGWLRALARKASGMTA